MAGRPDQWGHGDLRHRGQRPGDADPAVGTISDPGGPALLAAVPTSAAAIPTLSHFGLAMLTALLGLLAWHRRRSA